MQNANKQIVRQVFEEIFNQNKLDLVSKLYCADCVSFDPANNVQLEGVEPLIELVKNYRALFPDHRYEIQEMIAERNVVCVQWSVKTNSPKLTAGFSTPGLSLCYFRDGKISKVIQHWDNLGLFKEIGAVGKNIDIEFAAAEFVKLSEPSSR